MEARWKTIKLVEIKDELLPSGRKLLHCVFKDNYGNTYKWTPPWRNIEKGKYGVEQLFFQALEIEEWNDYDGAWDQELKKVAKKIPDLDERNISVRIVVGEYKEIEYLGKVLYEIRIDISSKEETVGHEKKRTEDYIRIGKSLLPWKSLKESLSEVPFIVKVTDLANLYKKEDLKEAQKIRASKKGKSDIFGGFDIFADMFGGTDGYLEGKEVGACFKVLIGKNIQREQIDMAGRELVKKLRFHIRESRCILAKFDGWLDG